MEVQDTVMEARGPSDVNTVDTAAFQPRYSLRSTDKVNRRESSVTKVDPHHCAIAETEKQHSSPHSRTARILQQRIKSKVGQVDQVDRRGAESS